MNYHYLRIYYPLGLAQSAANTASNPAGAAPGTACTMLVQQAPPLAASGGLPGNPMHRLLSTYRINTKAIS